MTYINRQKQYRPKGNAIGRASPQWYNARHAFPPHPSPISSFVVIDPEK